MHLVGCALLVTLGYFLIPGFRDEWPFLLALIIFTFPLIWIFTVSEQFFLKGRMKSSIKEVLLGILPAVLFIAGMFYFGPTLAGIFI